MSDTQIIHCTMSSEIRSLHLTHPIGAVGSHCAATVDLPWTPTLVYPFNQVVIWWKKTGLNCFVLNA